MANKKDGKKEMTASRQKIKDAREEKRTTRTVKKARKKLGKEDAQTGTVVLELKMLLTDKLLELLTLLTDKLIEVVEKKLHQIMQPAVIHQKAITIE